MSKLEATDVIHLEEGEISSDSDADSIVVPEGATVDQILEAYKVKKVYKVKFKRTLPEWLVNENLIDLPDDPQLEEAMMNHKD